MYKKLVATLLTVLMTGATFVTAALAQTTLSTYPDFLGTDVYIVVGSGANVADVVGAIDLGADIQQNSVQTGTCAGGTTTAVDGIEKSITLTAEKVNVAGGEGLPTTLQSFHYSGLKQGTYSFKGSSYRYHEAVSLVAGDDLRLDHGFSDSNVNGTMTLRIATNDPVSYSYIFDQDITSAPSYSDPLTINLAGKDFMIVGTSSSGLTALSGTIGSIDSTTGVTYNGYTVYAIDGDSGNWAKLQIKDSTGTVVQTDILNQGDVKTYTFGSTTFKVKLITVWTSTITNSVTAKVAVGAEVDKVYPTAATVDTNYVFPGETDWYVYWNDADSSANITNGDSIVVFYHPTDVQYLKAGDKLIGPNDYFELAYTGLTGFDTYATITVSTVSGKSIYASSTSTAAEATGLTGFEITSDVTGSLLYGSTGYDKAYILFNGTDVWQGYWDSVANKIIKLATATLTDANLNNTNLDFNISYGGVGDVTDTLRFAFNNQSSDVLDMIVGTTALARPVTWDFENVTPVGGASSAPTFRLGGTASSAQAGDVVVTYSTSGSVSVGDKSQDILSDTPIYIVSPNTNSASDKAVFKVPSGTVKAKVDFGKIGATTTTGGTTYKEMVPITTAIAKLDTEITTADKTTKNLVIVGGPCANELAWEFVTNVLNDSTYLCGGSAWTTGTSYIIVKDDAFATGKIAMLVAGTTKDDTRTATGVLSQDKIPSDCLTVSACKITGTLASPTGTPV